VPPSRCINNISIATNSWPSHPEGQLFLLHETARTSAARRYDCHTSASCNDRDEYTNHDESTDVFTSGDSAHFRNERTMKTLTEPSKKASILKGQLSDDMTMSERVWAMTVRIPAGQVATYGSIARALGVRSPRAVGQALHRNPMVPAVPCHRVVGSDGSLTGYALGMEKKRQLLRDEGVAFRGDRVDLSVSMASL
jgi:O-6-methylguanine DNA methyltransferase